jgi:hypothetical protein
MGQKAAEIADVGDATKKEKWPLPQLAWHPADSHLGPGWDVVAIQTCWRAARIQRRQYGSMMEFAVDV